MQTTIEKIKEIHDEYTSIDFEALSAEEAFDLNNNLLMKIILLQKQRIIELEHQSELLKEMLI